MKPKPRNWHPATIGWASLKFEIAWIRLLWEIARALRINSWYGVPDK